MYLAKIGKTNIIFGIVPQAQAIFLHGLTNKYNVWASTLDIKTLK
jgi:hypothetical protein